MSWLRNLKVKKAMEMVETDNNDINVGVGASYSCTYDSSKPIFDEYLTLCACNSSEHQMIWRVDTEDKVIYCDVHLVSRRWYERVWHALKYIFGHKSIYGEFEEFIFRKCDVPKFEKMLEALKESSV